MGWGGSPQVFASWKDSPDWEEERETIQRLLTPAQHEAARASTLDAHYTAPAVVSAMYDAVERLGFTGGRVLEPAVGLGHFFGLMPEDMAARSKLTGIELDPVKASIAAKLYTDDRHDQFLVRFGPINEGRNAKAFGGDPDLPLLLSLENFDEETRAATKTAIFTERTIHQNEAPRAADTAQDALVLTLNANWDGVIVTHASFEKIPMSFDSRQRFIDEQIHEVELAIRQQRGTRLVKELERIKKKLKAKLETLSASHRKDSTLTFEELGIDRPRLSAPDPLRAFRQRARTHGAVPSGGRRAHGRDAQTASAQARRGQAGDD